MSRTPVIVAAAAAACIVSGPSVLADVHADEKALVKFEGMLGRVVNIFGGKAAREGVKTTVAVKGDRKATLTDSTGQIIDLKEEKIYDLDIKRKTYKVTTFADLRRRMEEAKKRAEEDARKEQAKESSAPPEKNDSQKQMQIDFSIKETGQKKNINGFETREVVMTITAYEKGKTLEESGGLVLTGDTWLGPKVDAMKEIAEFDVRYARQLAGPMVEGASPEEMAAALAMYPMLKDAIARMRTENVNLDGTPILTTVTVDGVKSAEQVAAEAKQNDQSAKPSLSGGVGGLVGGFARRAAKRNDEPKSRATFMTMTNEVLKVTTDVTADELAVPSAFKETK